MTRGTHPPSLLRRVERALLDAGVARSGATILCACSGGPDSTAMLHALARLAPKLGFSVAGHGVDHGLRAEAPAELDAARVVADAVGVAFSTSRVDVGAGSNLQARARRARYAALAAAAARAAAAFVATGHTADDRAETVILRLLRGAGPRGLAVLPMIAPWPFADAELSVFRPLLHARRADVLAHVGRHRLVVAADPSNADPRFLRVRVRREVLPLLESLAPGVAVHLAGLADMLAELAPEASDLGRAQRSTVARARALGRPGVQLRVRGGRDVDVSFDDKELP